MFAVLHVADFALQAVLRLAPELRGRAVGLLDDTRRPPAIVACTAAAEAAGVQLGMTSPQAMARCPGIALRTRQLEAEADARAGLLAAAFSLAPQVEDTAPGGCTIQMSGTAATERQAALQRVVEQLEQLGLSASAGLAATPLLAWYAARYGHTVGGTESLSPREVVPSAKPPAAQCKPRQDLGDRRPPRARGRSAEDRRRWQKHYVQATEHSLLQAAEPAPESPAPAPADHEPMLARDRAPASGGRCVCIAPAATREFLRDLPLAVAEPPPETAAVLAGWGVRTLGQLTALTKADVTQRLGPPGLAVWERAAGEVTRPLQLISPPQTFVAELELEQPVETLEPLLFLLRRFIDRLALELRATGFVAGEMSLGLKLADDTVHTHEFRLPEPTAREDVLFRVLHTHLETLHTAAEVGGVALRCRPVRPLERQPGLFESALRDPHGFAETLARVAAVVGPDRVGTPCLENTHRPDAVRLVAPLPVVPPPEKEPECPPYGLPLRRFRPPWPANVELQGQVPAFVWTANLKGAVRSLAGPWRGSGDWWDVTHLWRREEWDVELEPGGVYRLLHTPDGWFVEGEYD